MDVRKHVSTITPVLHKKFEDYINLQPTLSVDEIPDALKELAKVTPGVMGFMVFDSLQAMYLAADMVSYLSKTTAGCWYNGPQQLMPALNEVDRRLLPRTAGCGQTNMNWGDVVLNSFKTPMIESGTLRHIVRTLAATYREYDSAYSDIPPETVVQFENAAAAAAKGLKLSMRVPGSPLNVPEEFARIGTFTQEIAKKRHSRELTSFLKAVHLRTALSSAEKFFDDSFLKIAGYAFVDEVLPGLAYTAPSDLLVKTLYDLLVSTSGLMYVGPYLACSLLPKNINKESIPGFRTQSAPLLSCGDGPALVLYDNTEYWYLEGHRVDKQLVMDPASQSINDITREDNIELRRIRAERFGWARFLKETNAAVIDERFNERDMQPEKLFTTAGMGVCLMVTDPSTGRQFVMRVPTIIKTCDEAQRWISHGLDDLCIHRS